ncbi:hypothetical protein AMTR_s00026p00068270 [Amborella trichopoda]|uniref:Pectate lyase superfamily protein domain-containing protein n=1 Tax=Amborella trichopoda TaxID=13333 RepID=W1PQL3_AMBTC|nr:hypothetical protein AMTR_s00026p00068270 [Amborella trichopoda]
MGYSKSNSKEFALLCYVTSVAMACAAAAAADTNSFSAGEFNVLQYGAIADGATDNSKEGKR